MKHRLAQRAPIGRGLLAAALCAAGFATVRRAEAVMPFSKSVKTYALQGETYLSLRGLARFYGLEEDYGTRRKPALESPWSRLTFEENSRRAYINGTMVWLHTPLARMRNSWMLNRLDMEHLIDPLLRSGVHLRGYRLQCIVLDPGHGGKDKGAIGRRNVEEKRVVYDVSRRLRVLLANQGFQVVLTRNGDRFLELGDRPAVARRCGADLFVSIHMNASNDRSARGVETFVLTATGYPSTNSSDQRRTPPVRYPGDAHAAASAVAGFHIQRGLAERTGSPDRGLRRARFKVIREAPCPAVLVEGGFVSNRIEENAMIEESYRQRIAQGIADGILAYANLVHRAQLATP